MDCITKGVSQAPRHGKYGHRRVGSPYRQPRRKSNEASSVREPSPSKGVLVEGCWHYHDSLKNPSCNEYQDNPVAASIRQTIAEPSPQAAFSYCKVTLLTHHRELAAQTRTGTRTRTHFWKEDFMGNELAACNESAPRLLGRESTLQGGLQAAEKGAAEADKMASHDSDSDDGFYVPYWRKKKPAPAKEEEGGEAQGNKEKYEVGENVEYYSAAGSNRGWLPAVVTDVSNESVTLTVTYQVNEPPDEKAIKFVPQFAKISKTLEGDDIEKNIRRKKVRTLSSAREEAEEEEKRIQKARIQQAIHRARTQQAIYRATPGSNKPSIETETYAERLDRMAKQYSDSLAEDIVNGRNDSDHHQESKRIVSL